MQAAHVPYYWTGEQTEWANDFIFHSREHLAQSTQRSRSANGDCLADRPCERRKSFSSNNIKSSCAASKLADIQ